MRWVLVGSLALELALALAFRDIAPRYDEVEFIEFGRSIADGAAPVAWRAPGYQWLVALGLLVAGGRTVGVRLVQVLLSVAGTYLVYRIGLRVAGERAGLAAAAFAAFYPSRVAFSHLLWSETLYGSLVLLAMERALAADDGRSGKHGLACGAALGAAALTRSIGLALLAATLVWIASRPRDGRSMRLATAVAAGALVVVVPWSVFASTRAGRLVVIDANSGFNLWSGNNAHIPDDLQGLWAVGLPLHNGLAPAAASPLPDDGWRGEAAYRLREAGIDDDDGPEADRWYRSRAMDEIAENPGRFAARVPRKLAALWAPDFFLARHLLRDWYGRTPPAVAAVLAVLAMAASIVPLVGGPVALAALGPSRFRALTLWWVGAYVVVHAIVYGHSRMHQPLVAILALAVAALVYGRDPAIRRTRRIAARGAPWIALVLAGWIWVAPVVVGLYIMPGPRHAAFARAAGGLRHLPLPGARRVAWMLAGVEASVGRRDRADRVLAEGPWADDPWSLYLRGRFAPPGHGEIWLRKALDADPMLFAAWYALAESQARRGDREGAAESLAAAQRARPWDPRPARAH